MNRARAEVVAAFLAGAAVAAGVALLLRPGREAGSHGGDAAEAGSAPPGAPSSSASRPTEGAAGAWTRLGDGLMEEWTDWMERMVPAPAVDLTLLRERLHAVSPDVEPGLLAPGIVEVVGSAPDPSRVNELLAAARQVPGVRTVVNRVWVEGDLS